MSEIERAIEKKEYIERGALIGAIEATEFLTMQDAATTLQLVTEAPAADVEPVVRSKWELHGGDDSLDCFWFCNNCGWNIEEESDANKWNRCPRCGAHMERSGSGE